MKQISVDVNTLINPNIGIMGKSVYKDDALVKKFKEIFDSNKLELPTNKVVDEKDIKVKLNAMEFNMLSMEVYSKFICYRNSFTYKKISSEIFDCIREIYYLIGIYNMLGKIGYINHSLNWDQRNLLLQDCARAGLWDKNNTFTTRILAVCLEAINKGKYKYAVETFFRDGSNNDYYFGEIYKKVNLPNLPPKLLIKFGFLKIKEDDKEIYLIPDYLVKSLFDKDELCLLNDAKNCSLYHEENLSKTTTGKILNYSYMPYYKDGIHLLYGFER